jgi:hypothetical protein
VAATLEAWADDSAEPEDFAREEVTERAAAVVKQHWPL